ncbi:hypothetical protein ID866_6739 [Astraeus odoratus]|nr:hypothetical protein ID866_6739 [Astraeus odoratus]
MPAAATSMTNSLEIQLTEPVIFLRMLERQQRRNVPIDNHREGSSPGALVRGVLTLTLAKAEKISSINVKLEGHAATNWIEGAGPSRIERSERYTVYSSSTVLFKAAPGSLRRGNQARRATSVLPLQRTYAIGYLDGARPFDTDFQSTQHSGNGRPELPLARHGNGNTTPLRMDGDSSTISAPESSYRGRRRSWHDSVEIELVKRDKQSDTRIFSDGVQSSVGENHTEPTPPYAPPPYPASQLDAGIPYLCPTEEEGGQEGEQGGSSIARDSTQIVLGSVSEDTTNNAIKEHAARSLSPLSRRGLSVSRTRTVDSDQSCRGRSYSSKGKSKVVDPPSPNVAPNGSTVAGDVDVCDTCKRGNGEEWVSFQEGKYNYPIVFALPPDAPPTAIAEHGSFTWRLEAEVKQPGSRRKPTRMMTVYRDVEVVGAPADDQLDEHPESAVGILLQRTWESNFDYRLDIPRRNVPLSGTLPFQLTIMPLLKVRIYQILVQLDGE